MCGRLYFARSEWWGIPRLLFTWSRLTIGPVPNPLKALPSTSAKSTAVSRRFRVSPNLAPKTTDEALFVPLLGFEGSRFAFMLENVQPRRTNIWPVVGVPGFRPEYPFYTFLGNRTTLTETRAWKKVRYAQANCPFALYQTLRSIQDRAPRALMRIATIGTKPHALGALLYSLDHPATTEILYDHPVRKPGRTSGMSRLCVYDLSLLPPVRTASPSLH